MANTKIEFTEEELSLLKRALWDCLNGWSAMYTEEECPEIESLEHLINKIARGLSEQSN